MTGATHGERRSHPVRGASHVPPFRTSGNPIERSFYSRSADRVARDLLGMILVSRIGGIECAGVIVETEAYTGPDDEASHAAARIGRTQRNDVMFGAPGLAYVYRIYGVHWCLNAVTDQEEHPSAVLIRAAVPILGLEIARARRGGRFDRDLMRGPGNLCAALGITGDLNRNPLDQPPVTILPGYPFPDESVANGPRIGVTRAADVPLRFWIRGSPWVSVRS